MINGEPGSALKARSGKWGQIKVEHRSRERGLGEAWNECRTQSPITVSVLVLG